ncbi:MAG: branched-chain amino acid transaminase [Candidatus Latescibacteria bacterium]|nr:branched-chain amino acid transaminase [Candidatus Latescibacterota bacterium]
MHTTQNPDVWMNGLFVPWDQACVHPFCHGLQRGSVVFESIDCNETINGKAAIFRLREHMIRFENSAGIIGMELDYKLESLMHAVIDTVARSGLKSCVIRPLAFYADPVMDVYPGDASIMVAIGLAESHEPPETYKVTISRFHKIDNACMPVKAKVSGNYINPMISKTEAKKAGFDDAILLDKDGYVAEGSTSNIFIVENNKLITAPEDSILLGITRDTIMAMAQKLSVEIIQEKFNAERLKHADEAILCSSGKEVTPIVQVDESIIGDGNPGTITKLLRSYYRDIIEGHVADFEDWLTYIQ